MANYEINTETHTNKQKRNKDKKQKYTVNLTNKSTLKWQNLYLIITNKSDS
jgi:hypothetical protein